MQWAHVHHFYGYFNWKRFFFTSTIIPNNPQYKPHASWTDHLKWYRIVFAASIDNNIRKGLSFNMIFENKENKVRNSKTYHNPFTNIKKEIISCCVGLLNALIKYAFRFWLCIVHYYRTDILMWFCLYVNSKCKYVTFWNLKYQMLEPLKILGNCSTLE